MNVYKLSLCPVYSHQFGNGVCIRAANTEAEARQGIKGIEEVELLPGLTYDPAVPLPPQLYDDEHKPLPGVISFDWFED